MSTAGANQAIGSATDAARGPTVLEERLKADLRRALGARDRAAVAALRVAVAAIDNAGSVEVLNEGSRAPVVGKTADIPRRELTEQEVVGLLRREVDELGAGISAAERHGSEGRARELRSRREVLAAYIGS